MVRSDANRGNVQLAMIRLASFDDLPRMADAAKAFYASSGVLGPFDLGRFIELWTDLFERGIGAIFVFEEADKIKGAIGGIIYPAPYYQGLVASEFFWFVKQEERGAGIKLYRQFEAWARMKGCCEIRMVHLVDSMPEKVATFYRKIGYHQVETMYAKSLP